MRRLLPCLLVFPRRCRCRSSPPRVADAAGPKAYVGNFSDNTVSVVDLTTGTVVATIPVSAGPHGMIVGP